MKPNNSGIAFPTGIRIYWTDGEQSKTVDESILQAFKVGSINFPALTTGAFQDLVLEEFQHRLAQFWQFLYGKYYGLEGYTLLPSTGEKLDLGSCPLPTPPSPFINGRLYLKPIDKLTFELSLEFDEPASKNATVAISYQLFDVELGGGYTEVASISVAKGLTEHSVLIHRQNTAQSLRNFYLLSEVEGVVTQLEHCFSVANVILQMQGEDEVMLTLSDTHNEYFWSDTQLYIPISYVNKSGIQHLLEFKLEAGRGEYQAVDTQRIVKDEVQQFIGIEYDKVALNGTPFRDMAKSHPIVLIEDRFLYDR